jgi:S1-C subfamily serine protease
MYPVFTRFRPLVAVLATAAIAIMLGAATTARADEVSFAKLYQTVKPSVVYVVSALPNSAASGSGFIYASTGSTSTVITANHVVEGATRVDVILDSDVHERYPATVVSRDHIRDVAVLSIPVGNRRALALEEPAKISEGNDIAIIGYPRAATEFEQVFADDLRPSVHVGIISAVRLNGELLQIDAQTDHGDSGGPIIDKNTGAVVAIVRGSLLDPTYLSRGIQQVLPGSSFGMSVATINQVLSGAPPASTLAAAGGGLAPVAAQGAPGGAPAAASTGTVIGAPVGGGAVAAAAGSSAAYRVGYGAPHFTDPTAENISQSVLQRFANAFTNDSAFYMIPVAFGTAGDNGQQLSGICDDGRLNAIVQPAVGWRAPRVYTATGAPAELETTVSLLVTDCSGGVVYFTRKVKSEGTKFSHRTTEREITDMSNDLLDQALADFTTFRETNVAKWDSLLKTGIFLDPSDTHPHSMLTIGMPTGTTNIRVQSVFTNGPAAQAGVMVGDIIESVNGTPATGRTVQQVIGLLTTPQITLVVRRPGGDATLMINQQTYSQLLATLRR